MSSFSYRKHSPKHIGLWLRYHSPFNNDIVQAVKKTKNKRFMDTVARVIVSEYDKETDKVWLQIWCKNLLDSIRGKHRHNVFYIKLKVNSNWSCHGDLGTGVDFFRK